MKYAFTSLAVGNTYEQNTIKFYNDLKLHTEHCNFFLTTPNDQLLDVGDRIHINVLNSPFITSYGTGFDFLFNLKCLSFKHILEFEKSNPEVHHDFVIYADADWGMHDDFSEEKVLRLFHMMEENNIDCVCERPAPIGPNKRNIRESFFADKISQYDIFDHDTWDDAHCFNEQFFVFRNNSKFKFFVQRWEQFLWYSIANNIRNYAEGFEIGISMLEAKMSWEHTGFLRNALTGCFYFHTAYGDKLYKF